MSDRYLKAHRKYAKENYKITLDEVLDTTCRENIFLRFWFCIKIMFKYYKKKKKITIKSKSTNKVVGRI